MNIKIAGKWMFIPLKMVLIGIDPYPYGFIQIRDQDGVWRLYEILHVFRRYLGIMVHPRFMLFISPIMHPRVNRCCRGHSQRQPSACGGEDVWCSPTGRGARGYQSTSKVSNRWLQEKKISCLALRTNKDCINNQSEASIRNHLPTIFVVGKTTTKSNKIQPIPISTDGEKKTCWCMLMLMLSRSLTKGREINAKPTARPQQWWGQPQW